jgi:3-hydroxyacyl-[acyl-carrier-protein] dehydratase
MATEADLGAMLPWSHPFQMVDRMLECVPHQRVVTWKRVTAGDPVAPRSGSGPSYFPAFLILEGLSQTAALLFRQSYGPEALSGAPMLGYLKAKIRGHARPGDTLRYTVTAIKMTSRNGVFSGVAAVDGKLVAATDLAFGVGERWS